MSNVAVLMIVGLQTRWNTTKLQNCGIRHSWVVQSIVNVSARNRQVKKLILFENMIFSPSYAMCDSCMGCPIVYTALMTLDRGWTEILKELSKDIMQLFLELGSKNSL